MPQWHADFSCRTVKILPRDATWREALRAYASVVKRSPAMTSTLPGVAPLFPAGKEPLPPGLTEEDREVIQQQKRYQDLITEAPHSCVGKGVLSTGAGA